MSCVFGTNRFHPIILTNPLPSFIPRVSSTTSAAVHLGPTNISTQKSSLSFKTRRNDAILDIQHSSDLGSALARSGGILRVEDLNTILRHFGKSQKLKELSQLFAWMQRTRKISFASYSSYIKHMGKSLDPVKALEIYDSITDESTRNHVSVCNSVLSCLVRSGKYDSSVKLFHQMKRDGLSPDIVTYSTLLAGCSKIQNGYSKALDLVQELKYNGLVMDSITYGTLLDVCASNNQCEEAEKYFELMKDEGHTPNVFHYGSLINAYSVKGNYKKADELIVNMKDVGLVPNKVILTSLLKVYVKGGLFDKARELLNDLDAAGHAQNEIPYCILMDGLAKAGQIQEAKSVFDEMNEKNVKSDGYSYSIMISSFCRSGLLEEAKELVLQVDAKYKSYDVVLLNTMLCAYCRVGEMENVMIMLRRMDELAITPDRNTFHILVKYFCKEKIYMLAYQTLEDMHKKGHQPEEELCSSLIFHLGKTGAHSQAFSVYNMLRYGKRSVCKTLHGKILHILIDGRLLKDAYLVVKDNARSIPRSTLKKFAASFMKFGNINLINDVIKALHSSGHKIDQGLFEMAISRYIDQPEKKDLLLQLLQWMPDKGYFVDSSTRNLLLKNSKLFGAQQIAETLSRQHISSKAPRSHEMKDNLS
ncbi:hypothetical protein DCAR_0729111 [Daucus carota subsp. sativus]|uniref:Pentacotripeptide-repeat region of PRORP domain-containing protein n=1 Tax=Daucus carota subsp. sativus TaxID=79200 RepID=A0AAF1B9G7_DAUCS|nr:PREDICTED: pentatricopeptide repeat-containing protein At1g10910, chloroplastic [Daucus carota subsp. sativus]XP_017218876.1 PREDICTED: pentatricopeptide repeat-containing protein At1g10910, chloroplastic [Daucus carota subsp. sativus]WOH09653.1 hypothetical protein DCAR_0729111 [Daucus carota subsp. sativus]